MHQLKDRLFRKAFLNHIIMAFEGLVQRSTMNGQVFTTSHMFDTQYFNTQVRPPNRRKYGFTTYEGVMKKPVGLFLRVPSCCVLCLLVGYVCHHMRVCVFLSEHLERGPNE